jgi:hypothetical protein
MTLLNDVSMFGITMTGSAFIIWLHDEAVSHLVADTFTLEDASAAAPALAACERALSTPQVKDVADSYEGSWPLASEPQPMRRSSA